MAGLPKKERLYGERPVGLLFAKGKRFMVVMKEGGDAKADAPRPLPAVPADYSRFSKKKSKSRYSQNLLQVAFLLTDAAALLPLSVQTSPEEGAIQGGFCRVMVNAPKRCFLHAVDRNRVKRLLREAYRACKEDFSALVPEGKILLLSLQFTGKRDVSLPEIKAHVEKTLRMLRHRLLHA